MALATPPPAPSKLITYEDYLTEGEINRRYDIIDGVRIFMPSPTPLHQLVAFQIGRLLDDYRRRTRRSLMFLAPRDIMIEPSPLRTRQPDVFLISRDRLGGHPPTDPSPFTLAPELVVEVLSESDTRTVRLAKIADYCAIGVNECWLVGPQTETVETLRLTTDGPQREAIYGIGQTLQSLAFPDLTLALADMFDVGYSEED